MGGSTATRRHATPAAATPPPASGATVLPVGNESVTFHVGRDELTVRQRYEAASILNDILIAAWFVVGSLLFFSPALTTAGTWCFLAGSVELLIRPLIRLGRHLHLRRLRGGRRAPLHEAPQDF